MKILIVGASRGTGAESSKAAVARGHQVTAFARNPDALAFESERLTKHRGDFHDSASVDDAVRGQEAVIVTASSTSLRGFRENPTYFSEGTRYVIESMQKRGVRRLAVLSALGTGDSRPLLPWVFQKLVVSFLLKVPFEDHERQEQLVRESGLEWVIARPSRLTRGPARRRYVARSGLERVPASISRADVADFLVKAVEGDTWAGQAVQLGG
jgi:uncharacterized protein YbjT (DUF2867 family)